ncbi:MULTISPECIES: hypothetical protein [Klebsiella/Raoultella group]|uniref:hypothetical protein n=1 Tax=Klebsiella/Raoultella group TaxID=2890311 RepID=UPI00100A187C|nr:MULTISPECIES: hypothetical protein [Klebsiella/Raoultella group]QAV82117.1 hypothetical protein ES964_26960 [Klebsiella pneumoniae]WFW01847.1 hypothetical protein NFJ54_26250 [Klebsiella aerogenes]WSI11167.1 hypothetical protein VTY38_28105 [Klebsiella pneumoniae]
MTAQNVAVDAFFLRWLPALPLDIWQRVFAPLPLTADALARLVASPILLADALIVLTRYFSLTPPGALPPLADDDMVIALATPDQRQEWQKLAALAAYSPCLAHAIRGAEGTSQMAEFSADDKVWALSQREALMHRIGMSPPPDFTALRDWVATASITAWFATLDPAWQPWLSLTITESAPADAPSAWSDYAVMLLGRAAARSADHA